MLCVVDFFMTLFSCKRDQRVLLIFYSGSGYVEVDAWSGCCTCYNTSGVNVYTPRVTTLAVPKGWFSHRSYIFLSLY